jgi:tetratricopeptide (TPR) repeat protein
MATAFTPPNPDPASDPTRVPAEGVIGTQSVGPYRLLRRLGEGGMGEVWLAQQLHPIRRQVAIKVIKAGMDTAQVIARFEAERQALAVMDHPAIAKIFDGGSTAEGRPYFAMEYVHGEAITGYCDRERLSIPQRLELFIQLCEGVQHAHQKGIIHRDLKPSNVLISVSGDRPIPRIIDFGIAKAVSQPLSDRALFTEVGGFLGTPEYMSPEQADASPADVDTRSDIYSLGVLLYELLVGVLPFESAALRSGGADEIRRTIREKAPPRPSTRVTPAAPASTSTANCRRSEPARLAGLLRGDLDWITMKALEKDRARRYQTANALALDVRRHLNQEPVAAGPPGATYRVAKFVRRHAAWVAAGATLVALLLAFTVLTALQAGRVARERDRANQERDRANQEAATAKQTTDFLVGLFEVSDPSESRGNTLTAREILESGARQVESGLQGQPLVRARLEATIGTVYTGLGMFREALPLLERSLASHKASLGEDHPDTLATANGLANVYWYLRNYQAAEPLYRDIAQRRTRVSGEDHPATLKVNFDLASVYLQQQRWDEYERLGNETLARQRRVLGGQHPDTLSSMNNLQNFYYRQGRYAEAEPLATEVFDVRRSVLGPDHPDSLRATHNLASIHDKMRRDGIAEQLYQNALKGQRKVIGSDHPSAIRTLTALGNLYARQQRYALAEPALLEAYDRYARTVGSGDSSTQAVVEQLVRLYEATGRPAAADDWARKRLGIAR